MRKFSFFLLLSCLIFFSQPSYSIEHKGGMWIEACATGPLCDSEKFLYQAEFSNNLEDSEHFYHQYILKLGLGYKLENCSLWLGYSIPPVYEEQLDDFLGENRFWQEFVYSEGSFSFRAIFEQRFKEHGKYIKEKLGTDFCGMGFRFRQKLSFNPKLSKKISPLIYDELFFELKETPWANRGLSENYLFIGCVIHFTENCSLEFGYLNDYTVRSTCSGSSKMAHNLSMSLTYNT